MGVCGLVDQLNRLRKSSSDSIDNEKKFDIFKQYMHVNRDVESDLKEILRHVNASHQKTLVLLCGSAGDGKSHMLSYLKNSDEEKLLENFRIHNDATESSAPDKTAIETLSDVLNGFSDENIDMPGKNYILAINLGVLNNFIESSYGENFKKMRKYVNENCILSTEIIENGYKTDSVFQHVSFADYQLYTLSQKGVCSEYIESLLEKIFGHNNQNIFLQSFYHDCGSCALQKNCPVKYNFSFLRNENVRKYISAMLIMSIIKEKDILTTREILNYIYDITVPQDFTYTGLSDVLANTSIMLKYFVNRLTPSLMFEQNGVSTIMEHIKRNDPILDRNEQSDDFAIEYYVASDERLVLENTLSNNPYRNVILQDECIDNINNDRDVKSIMFKCLIRIIAIENNQVNDRVYESYISALYNYNAGLQKKMGALYEAVEKAVLQWCGTDGDNHLCLNGTDSKYSLFEQVEFDADLNAIPNEKDQEELKRFIPELKVGYLVEKSKESILLEIDYSLYELILRLNNGYIHTANDKNNHADFISFMERILKNGNADEELFIISKEGRHASLRKTKFGYKFGVVR